MATNFEFYKEQLTNDLGQHEGRCIVAEVDEILQRGFWRFCNGSDCGECWRKLFKYLAEEHMSGYWMCSPAREPLVIGNIHDKAVENH